uniref:Golgi associated, gamma adaptin ear containing, ARF binding protein 2 n=1 Tax=Anabas testudineus TaxID=64144 RepID=A0A7N6AV37_ANATE
MACGDSPATFESWLNHATDPNNQEDRWDCIQGFYQLVNQDTDGPQIAVRLLAHKIQSPQEKEALQALTVLEACMNNCGKRFHTEAAKFRFLNELIKVLTPKYFGAWTPQKVKDRVIEVLYGWTLWLKDEPKVQEAYSMLKKQGFVKKDPKLSDKLIMAPPPQRPPDSVFDQEDKAKLLARLLKSSSPEDLETANRLIKSTIKEEQERTEKVLKRESTLKEVESSTKQLRELLDQHRSTGTPLQPSDDMKALCERCDRLRPSLFRLASDTVEDDAALAQILSANDELTLVVNAYKDQVRRRESNGGRERSKSEEELIRHCSLNPLHPSFPLILKAPSTQVSSVDLHLYGFNLTVMNMFCHLTMLIIKSLITGLNNLVSKQTPATKKSYYEELMQVNFKSMDKSRDLKILIWNNLAGLAFLECLNVCCFLVVGQLEPITLYDQGGVHASLHFAKDSPPGHPGVAVVVISTVNTSALDVKDFLFQAAVPKTMLVKLQPASGTRLPPYNPLLPPPAISQVLLLANPEKRKVRLRYKLTLTHGDQHLNETREIDCFPDWTSLIGH